MINELKHFYNASMNFVVKNPFGYNVQKHHTYPRHGWFVIMNQFVADIQKYKPKAIVGYNIQFDMNAIFNTIVQTDYLRRSEFEWLTLFPTMDLWDICTSQIGIQKGYQRWVEEMQAYTPTGKFKTTCEQMYRYVTKDSGHIQSHTAKEDVLNEIELWKHAWKQHKAYHPQSPGESNGEFLRRFHDEKSRRYDANRTGPILHE